MDGSGKRQRVVTDGLGSAKKASGWSNVDQWRGDGMDGMDECRCLLVLWSPRSPSTISQTASILTMRRHVRTHSSRGSRGGTSLRVFFLPSRVLQIAGLRA